MNKKELITNAASELGMTKIDTEKVFEAFINIITDTLIRDEKISIVGFGTLEPVERAAKIGRNPKTGELMNIEAYKTVKFKMSSALKDMIRKR